MSRQIRLRCHGGHTIETMEETMTRCGKLSLFLSHTGGSEYRVPFNYSIVTKLLQYTRTLNVQYLDEVPLYWRDILGLSFQEGLDGIHMGETIQIGDDDFFVSDVILALIPQWTLVASEIAEEEFAAILEGLLQVYYKREKEDLESLEKEYSEVLHLLGYSGCPWPTKEKQKEEEEKRNKRDMILFVSPLLGSPMCTHIATLWRNGMLCYSEIWRNDTQRLWLTWKGELEFEYVQVDMFGGPEMLITKELLQVTTYLHLQLHDPQRNLRICDLRSCPTSFYDHRRHFTIWLKILTDKLRNDISDVYLTLENRWCSLPFKVLPKEKRVQVVGNQVNSVCLEIIDGLFLEKHYYLVSYWKDGKTEDIIDEIILERCDGMGVMRISGEYSRLVLFQTLCKFPPKAIAPYLYVLEGPQTRAVRIEIKFKKTVDTGEILVHTVATALDSLR